MKPRGFDFEGERFVATPDATGDSWSVSVRGGPELARVDRIGRGDWRVRYFRAGGRFSICRTTTLRAAVEAIATRRAVRGEGR
jgi:hypothetical protein